MKRQTVILRATGLLSVIFGLLFFFSMLLTQHEQRLQTALLGFLLGASIVWIVYLALWFISRGVSRTMFPGLSRLLVMKYKQKTQYCLSGYQEKMFIESVGAVLTIASLLCIAALAFFVLSGILYIAGRLSW